eukprot:617689-Prymnesium_polylepis.1
MPLPFWPLLARVAVFLRALLNTGMPSEDVATPRRAQLLVVEWAARLDAPARLLRSGEVCSVARPPGTYLDQLSPPLLRSDDATNEMVNNHWGLRAALCARLVGSRPAPHDSFRGRGRVFACDGGAAVIGKPQLGVPGRLD